jgi:hypothetical protein
MGPKPALLLGSGIGLSLFLLILGSQRMYGFSALLLALCGWCVVTFYGTANTMVQLNTEDRLRGRVMSIYTMAFAGFLPSEAFLQAPRLTGSAPRRPLPSAD